jgi:hypothetical protein
MRRAFLLGLLFLVATFGVVAAQPYRPAPSRPVWDSSGWTLLGEQWVEGSRRADRDHINVGRYEGRFSKLTIVVTDSDLEMLEFTVNFPRGQAWSPAGINHYFRENSRTRVIDLPGDDRRIESIDLKYRNLPGGGRAKVQVWGFKTSGAPVPPPPPPQFSWDSRGWTLLGEQWVDYGRRADRDRMNVGRYEGRFSKLTVVVTDSDLELLGFTVNFPRGQAWSPAGVNHYFRENSRTRVIDLPGDNRVIESIDLRYRNLPGGGRAKVQVWGFKAAPPAEFSWDNRGWTMLGEQWVDYGRRADRDRMNVGRYEGRFSKLTVVVTDSDLELLGFTVNFPRGQAWSPAGINHYFRENSRTRVIDLPGDNRVIESIDLRYRNLPGGGRAKVQVWGFKAAPPAEFSWDNRGWTMLGEQVVDYGRRADRDRINVGRYEGRFSKLTVVVLDSDLELLNFQVNFPRGPAYAPAVNHYFRENQRTRVIDLPGDDRVINSIDMRYRNLPGGGRARVQVWGFKQAPPPAFSWDNRGWTMLGEQVVDYGRRADRDRINVGRYEGRFSKLTVVVLDSDLELLDFTVNFPRGQFKPAVNHYFRESQRTRVIDLPGDDRVISSIDLRYRNLPGGGRARVQVWGFRGDDRPTPPPAQFTWDNRGWTLLGEQVVDYGRRADRDRINVGRYEGRFSKLTIVVLDSDLQLLDFTVNFPRGGVYKPAVNHYFRENQRTRVIDLPGDDRRIESIDLMYKNLPGGGRAKVQVWGFKTQR